MSDSNSPIRPPVAPGAANGTPPGSAATPIEVYIPPTGNSSVDHVAAAAPQPGETSGQFVDRIIAAARITLPEGLLPFLTTAKPSVQFPREMPVAQLIAEGRLSPGARPRVEYQRSQGALAAGVRALTPELKHERMLLEAKWAQRCHDDPRIPATLTGHRDRTQAVKGVSPVPLGGFTPPRAYRVRIGVPTLRDSRTMQPATTAVFDLLAEPLWPYKPIEAWALDPKPWSPHVRLTDGKICTHREFDFAEGTTFLIDVIRTFGLVLNYQEPVPRPPYFNDSAMREWTRRGHATLGPFISWPDLLVEAGARG